MTSPGGSAAHVATRGGAEWPLGGPAARVATFSGAPVGGSTPGAAPVAASVHTAGYADGGVPTGGLPRRVYPALLRAVLYAGVERPVIALEATIAIGLVATVGPRLVTLAAVSVIVGVLHPVMAWVTSKDPLATAIYVRSLGWKDYYAPHAGVRATKGRVRPTLPV